jgi:hypothetical protein
MHHQTIIKRPYLYHQIKIRLKHDTHYLEISTLDATKAYALNMLIINRLTKKNLNHRAEVTF